MATALKMGSAVERLTGLVGALGHFDMSAAELLPLQLEAADELFQDRVGRIGLLRNRAEEAGTKAVRAKTDIVPLLFAHTTYKSYPEGWLVEGKWDRMGRWLDTVSANRVPKLDLDGVEGIDDWLGRLADVGHYVSCSSGTTGKSAMLNASAADLDFTTRDAISALHWATGIAPDRDRRFFGLAPVAQAPRSDAIKDALLGGWQDAASEPFFYPIPPITIGAMTGMVVLRRAIADGTAKPGDIAVFEATSAERAATMERAAGIAADTLVAARGEKMFLSGMWAALYNVAQEVRARGFAGQFNPQNMIYIAGGLKGAILPPDYREIVFETFNLAPERVFQLYSMQELNSAMPRCAAGRYHVPPWVIPMILDQPGETLVETGSGEVEGRAAFFDLSLEGRWNGVISGDKIVVDYDRCPCGHASPSVHDSITRYADLPGGDKISCAGTADAYVRGIA